MTKPGCDVVGCRVISYLDEERRTDVATNYVCDVDTSSERRHRDSGLAGPVGLLACSSYIGLQRRTVTGHLNRRALLCLPLLHDKQFSDPYDRITVLS